MTVIWEILVIISTTALFAEVCFEYFCTVMLAEKCHYLLIPQRQQMNQLNNYVQYLDQ